MSNRIHWNGGDLVGCGLLIGLTLLVVIGIYADEFATVFFFATVLLIGAGCLWLVVKIFGGLLNTAQRSAMRLADRAKIRAAEKASKQHEQRRLANLRGEAEEKELLRAKAAEELEALRATMQITADGKIPGWQIVRRIRLITTDNYEAKDNPELVFLRHVKEVGGNGVINLRFHDRQGRFVSIRGEAVEVIKAPMRKGTKG